MKKLILLTILILSVTLAGAQKKVGKVKIKTENDSLSYALGINIAHNLKSQNVDNLNPMAIAKAFEDYYAQKSTMTSDEANAYIQEFFDSQEAKKHEEIVKQGEKFLAENAKKSGVVTTKSGLQYKIITPGTGKIPVATDRVEVNYEGRLIDGTVFDSSYQRGTPATFGVTQVIKGWTEALQLMSEGSKWELYIPYNLAYGSRGAGQDIKPFATLIFTVELLSIK